MTEPSENFMSSRSSMIPREMSNQLMRPVGATTIIQPKQSTTTLTSNGEMMTRVRIERSVGPHRVR